MPRYLIERNFADQLEVTKDAADRVRRVNEEEGVKWLFSFLSTDKRKTYCLYEAPNAEAIRIAARRANIPADVIIEVGALMVRRAGTASLLSLPVIAGLSAGLAVMYLTALLV